jgi:3-dehydroquinate synthetase
MVDASVGGKTGVDFGPAKNSVGSFWQPSGVICETDFVKTEGERAYRGALAEVVKTAVIGDPELFDLLESCTADVLAREPETVAEIVHRSVALKAWVVGTDERESGIRAWLNLGHTLGHALEAHGEYSRLTHGEAVSLGMVAALRIGERLGETPRELTERVVTLLGRLGLPSSLAGEPVTAAAELLGHDKKRAGAKLRFVLARRRQRQPGGSRSHGREALCPRARRTAVVWFWFAHFAKQAPRGRRRFLDRTVRSSSLSVARRCLFGVTARSPIEEHLPFG